MWPFMEKLWLFTFLYKYSSLLESGFFVFGWLIFKDEKKIQNETGTQRQDYFKDNFNKPQILPQGSSFHGYSYSNTITIAT
jgi:hypothetical protein